MKLISLEAAIEALESERDCLETPARINGVEDAIEVIQHLSSVPAVPLDKLCEWLAGNAWHLDCSDCDSEHCDCPQLHDDSGSSPSFWKAKLTKWMEEQNA